LVVETLVLRVCQHDEHKASMGPRLFGRGNCEKISHGEISAPASMGPRLFGRGNRLVRRSVA